MKAVYRRELFLPNALPLWCALCRKANIVLFSAQETRRFQMPKTGFPAGIGVVVPYADKRARNAVIRIFAETAGIKPSNRRDSVCVKRALYAPAISRTILNFSSAEVLKLLDYPQAVLTAEVENTGEAAEIARRIYSENGLTAQILDAGEIEIGIPKDFMHFVLVYDLPPLLFWPRNPTPEQLAKLVPAEPWTWD
jgi:hypothetical protein